MNKLIKMILESKAIDTPEGKQHWINQLEIMTPEQKEKLKDILTREKKKLKENTR